MTSNQVKWARQHDWYSYCTGNAADGYTVVVADWECIDDEWMLVPVEFSDYQKLKEWAGY